MPVAPPPPALPRMPPPPPRQPPPPSQDDFEPADDWDEEGEAALAEMEHEERGPPAPVAAAAPPPPAPPSAPPVAPAVAPAVASAAATVPARAPAAPAAGLSGSNRAAASSVVSARCIDCGEAEGQSKFFDAYGVWVCYSCQRGAQGAGGKYQVLTKSKAKDEYLLTDRQLDRAQGGLGCMARPNPHDSRYGDMRLYLRTQVEEVALQMWESDEGLFLEKERRSSERLEKSEARKRKAALPPSQRLKKPTKRGGVVSKAPIAKAASTTHTHVWAAEEEYDEASDTWTKRCETCGFEVEYERI